MYNKKGNLLIVLLVEILILFGCNTTSGKYHEKYKYSDEIKPKVTPTQLTSTRIPITEFSLKPTKTQTEPNLILNTPVGLCNNVPEPLLNHLPDPSGEEYLSGKFYLCSLPSVSAFDFDEGKVTDADNRESDIQLEIGKATFDNHIIYYINDVNDSFVDEIEPQSPTYSECKELVSSPTRLGYVLGIPSNSGCIQTDKGRLGYFRILEINPIGDESIEFFFVIWNKKD